MLLANSELHDDGEGGAKAAVEARNESYADMVERLFREFENDHSLVEIVDIVQQARHDLATSPPQALPELVERLARQRLSGN